MIFSLALATLLGACTQPVATVEEAMPSPSAENILHAAAPGPVSFEQMRGLVADVLGTDAAAGIVPTSRYVRLRFDDVERMCEHYMRGPVELSPEPLLGETYDVDAAEDGKPRPMYALVESGTPLPEEARCDVLAEYFDPMSPLSGLTPEQAEAVMRALTPATRAATAEYDWYPSGRVEIYDELAKVYVPISGVSVVVTGYKGASDGTVLQTETCITDSEGRYTCKKLFYSLVSERVKWSNLYWNIMEDNANVAYTNSPALDRKPWNLVVRSSSPDRAMQFASAYRAANFMHNNEYCISNMDDNGTSTVNIRCLDEAIPANTDDRFEQSPVASNIMTLFVYCKRKTPFEIHNVVQRELGKAVHRLRVNASTNDYDDFSKVVRESWGELTKYHFAMLEYQGLSALNTIQNFVPDYQADYGFVPARPDALNGQSWFYNTRIDANSQCRTPMFIDIIDDFDQSTWPENFDSSYIKYPQDQLFSRLIAGFYALEKWSLRCKNVSDVELACYAAVQLDLSHMRAIDQLFTVYKELEAAL